MQQEDADRRPDRPARDEGKDLSPLEAAVERSQRRELPEEGAEHRERRRGLRRQRPGPDRQGDAGEGETRHALREARGRRAGGDDQSRMESGRHGLFREANAPPWQAAAAPSAANKSCTNGSGCAILHGWSKMEWSGEIRSAGRGSAGVRSPTTPARSEGRQIFSATPFRNPLKRLDQRSGMEGNSRKIEGFLAHFGAPGRVFRASGALFEIRRAPSRRARPPPSGGRPPATPKGEGLRVANARNKRRKPLESFENTPGFWRQVQVPFLKRAAARIWLSVVVGVIASGSIFTWMIEGRPEPSARSNAGRNSAVSSTVSPWPPKARA